MEIKAIPYWEQVHFFSSLLILIPAAFMSSETVKYLINLSNI